MLTKRIIPCLDVRDGRVVKGVNFENIVDAGDPAQLAAYYNSQGADELVFYDITASVEGRGLFSGMLEKVASTVFIPLTAGGGVSSVEDFDRILKSGADKVSVNSGAIADPGLISRAADKYGDQCVVLSMDVKRVDGRFMVFSHGGRRSTGLDAIQWALEGQRRGAGELVANSIDTDGVKNGFDIQLLAALTAALRIPVIASGGAGRMEHFLDVFRLANVDAGLAASIFHSKAVAIPKLKEYLRENDIPMRIPSER